MLKTLAVIDMKNSFLLFALLFSSLGFSQGNDEIIIVGTAERKLEPAYRITENPGIIDTMIKADVTTYPYLAVMYPTSIVLDTINAAKVKTTDKLAQLYPFYVKVGVGSQLMPLGEFYFNSQRSRKYVYGAHIKHLSSFGNIKNYAPAQFDRSNFELFGGINESKYTLRGDLRYNNRGLHYYGIQFPAESDSLRDSIRQRYHDVGGIFSFAWHKKDSASLNFKSQIEYNHFSSLKPKYLFDVSGKGYENYFAIVNNAFYKFDKHLFSADIGVRYNGYRFSGVLDSAIALNNTVVNLKPTFTTYLKDNRFKATIGVDFVIDAHQETKVYLYPVAEIKYSMFNDIFIPYLGIKGGLKQQTFKSLTYENEFLLPNLQLQNENTVINFYGGFKGTLSKRVSFNLGASFSRIRNMAFFINDTLSSSGNKFSLGYDTVSLTQIEASISYQLNEKIKVDVLGKFNSYQLNNFAYAWNKPVFEFMVRGHYNLFDKFYFNLDLGFEQGRKALVYAMEPENVTLVDGQYVRELGIIVDGNLGVEYRYNKRISAFLQFNNFAAQRYQRWSNYPVQGIQVLGGVTFRF
ncbi:MAG: hypothetical protein V4638_00495 [Bacteroidota bacterium]